MTDHTDLITWGGPWQHLQGEVYCQGFAKSGRSYLLVQDACHPQVWHIGHHGNGNAFGALEDAKTKAEKQEAALLREAAKALEGE